ncbi:MULTISPECIES: hypothetical protein [unclassified Myroides]|uniref:hypothetical protein n=1 Tax=unclassified Myroides TaxID=2642485 RepID=UPI003D2F8571
MRSNQFYTFSSKLSSSAIQAHAISLNKEEDENGFFDQHKLIQGAFEGDYPIVFKQEYGSKLEDVLDTGWPSLFLISNQMKILLEENKLTGWSAFSVKLLGKNNKEIDGYHGLSIQGRTGKIDFSQSKIIEKRLGGNTPLSEYYLGMDVNLDEWDGSDFFLPENSFEILVTGRTAEILKKSKFTNIRLENIETIEIPIFALKKD